MAKAVLRTQAPPSVYEHSHFEKRELDDRYVRLNKAATLRTIADLAAVDLAPRHEPGVPN